MGLLQIQKVQIPETICSKINQPSNQKGKLKRIQQ